MSQTLIWASQHENGVNSNIMTDRSTVIQRRAGWRADRPPAANTGLNCEQAPLG